MAREEKGSSTRNSGVKGIRRIRRAMRDAGHNWNDVVSLTLYLIVRLRIKN